MLSDFGQSALGIKSHVIFTASTWGKSNYLHFASRGISGSKKTKRNLLKVMKLEREELKLLRSRFNVFLALKTMIFLLYYAESCFFLRKNIFHVILISIWVPLKKSVEVIKNRSYHSVCIYFISLLEDKLFQWRIRQSPTMGQGDSYHLS